MKRILYLGTDPQDFIKKLSAEDVLVHYPIIKLIPRSVNEADIQRAYREFASYTHVIFTSKNAVKVVWNHLGELNKQEQLKTKTMIAIGNVTAKHLEQNNINCKWIAKQETQEGMIQLIQEMGIKDGYLFFPRSSLSRPVLSQYLQSCRIRHRLCDVYDNETQWLRPLPDLNQMDEVIFTSPSTVRAFIEVFGKLPKEITLKAIGPITEQELKQNDLMPN